MTYTLPPLSYEYDALEPHLSAKILELHHDRHHATYVKGLNTSIDQLAEARDKGDFGSIVGLEKTFVFNLGGHVLHSIYWTNLSPSGGGEPLGSLADAIADSFGDLARFRKHFTAATVSVQGSGWGLLSVEPIARRLVIEQLYDHQGNTSPTTIPVLAVDAWEHAYYAQYFNDRAGYVDAVWNIIDWRDVQARYDRAGSAA
jgi:superoxide dismutase, Fe-Mn family